MTTRVVNKRFARPSARDVFVGRPSIFGNPYRVGADGDLQEVLLKYQVWLNTKLMEPEFRAEFEKLANMRLVCFCRPPGGFRGELRCHAQFLAALHLGCEPEEVP